MLSVHALIGLGEAVLTLTACWLIERGIAGVSPRKQVARLLAVALLLAGLCAPFASASPDGLEQVAAQLGFAEHAATGLPSLLPDYQLTAIQSAAVSTALAGLIGTLAVFAVGISLEKLLNRN
jgi:hypothetical protein